MSKIFVHNYKLPLKNVKKKIIYHLSDLHLNIWDDISSTEEKEYAIKQTEIWEKIGLSEAIKHNLIDEGMSLPNSKQLFDYFLDKVCTDGDALVLTGDILNQISGANIRFLKEKTEKFPIPILYVCGNHENGGDPACDTSSLSFKKDVQKLEFEDIVILGFNDSSLHINENQNLFLAENLKAGKPIIIAMHIPVITDDNHDKLIHNHELYINNHLADENTLKFSDTILNHEKTAAILAGHYHINDVSKAGPYATQFIAPMGISGNINRYEIGE